MSSAKLQMPRDTEQSIAPHLSPSFHLVIDHVIDLALLRLIRHYGLDTTTAHRILQHAHTNRSARGKHAHAFESTLAEHAHTSSGQVDDVERRRCSNDALISCMGSDARDNGNVAGQPLKIACGAYEDWNKIYGRCATQIIDTTWNLRTIQNRDVEMLRITSRIGKMHDSAKQMGSCRWT